MTQFEGALNHLLKDPEVVNYLLKELLKKRFSNLGLKVKQLDTKQIWILATFDACCKLSWVNTETGCTWGGPFNNSENPFDKLKNMKYQVIMPEFKE